MAVSNQSHTAGTPADDATWRTWATALSTVLRGCGLVKTADTGQVADFSAAVRPAASTAAGYEIFRFNDAMQATAPLFLKVEYGTSVTPTRPAYWVTVGRGSDGAGAITGGLLARTQLSRGGDAPGQVDTFASHGEGWLTIAANAGGTADGGVPFLLDRVRDDAGVPTAEGFLAAWSVAGSISSLTAAYDGSWSDSSTSGPATLNASQLPGGTAQYKGEYQAFPTFPILGYPRPASRSICMAGTADVAGGQQFSVPLGGAPNKTFRGIVGGTVSRGAVTFRFCGRYE